jgi:hypothetical protein
MKMPSDVNSHIIPVVKHHHSRFHINNPTNSRALRSDSVTVETVTTYVMCDCF